MPAAYKTLGALVSDLSGRLGYGSQGAATGVLRRNLVSILQQAQVTLYWTHDWARFRRYWDDSLGVNQYLLDYPDGCNPDRIKAISIQRDSVWTPPLKRGITPEMYTTQANTSYPWRWEPYEQIEFFPKSNAVYPIRVFGMMDLNPFAEDGDHATLDHDMIFTVALAKAKGHYRQPDAAIYIDDANSLTIKLKAKSWGQSVFNPYDYHSEPLARPVVV